MTEVIQIFPADEAKKVLEVGKAIGLTDEKLQKMLINLEKTSAILNGSAISTDKLTQAQTRSKKASNDLDVVGKQLEQTEQRLKNLGDARTTQIIKNRQEIQKQTKEVKLAVTATEALKGSYAKISAELSKNLAKYKNMSAAQRDSTKSGKTLEGSIKRQRAELTKLDSRMGNHTRNVGNYRGAIISSAKSLMGAFGLVGGVMMFAQVMKSAFSTIRSFTKENAVLAGVLGKTRDEVTDLTKQAVSLGSIYPITASEVTKLQISFSRLGFTMVEIKDLTEATIQGSIALNAELDATATLVGAIVRAYSYLGTTDAQDIIDQLTLATQRSSLSFASLETALPKVAGAANAMNIPLEKTLALLSVAQDATLDASISGTSLRNIFLELSTSGIDLDEALGKINNSSNQLNTSYKLFGKRGAIVGLALANNIELTQDLTKEYKEHGNVAEIVAKEQMNTLDGSIKNLASSWEKTILSFRNSEGFFRSFLDKLSGDLDVMSGSYLSFYGKITATIPILGSKLRKFSQDTSSALFEIQKASTAQELELVEQKYSGLRGKSKKFDNELFIALRERYAQVAQIGEDAAKREKLKSDREKVKKMAFEDELLLLKKTGTDKEIERTTQKYKKLISKAKLFGIDIFELEQMQSDEITSIRTSADAAANKKIEDERKKHFDTLRKDSGVFYKMARVLRRKQGVEKKEELKVFSKQETDDSMNELVGRNAKKVEVAKTTVANEKVARDEAEQERLSKIDFYGEAASMITQGFSQRKMANLEREFQVLEMNKEAELAKEGITADEKQKIEEKYAAKANKLKTKQAKAERRQSLIDVAINTAVAVSKAWGQTGIFGIAAQIPVLIMGALSAATILAQPLPKFKGGTKDAPRSFIAGDGGRELVSTLSGKSYLANKDTVFSGNEFKGATVHTNTETEKILSQGRRSGNINFDTKELQREQKRGTRQIVKAIKTSEYRRNRELSNEYKQKFL